MSQQTLKELLKPPFRYDCGTIFDSNDQVFCRLYVLLPGLGELTAAALNEKWERDFGCEKDSLDERPLPPEKKGWTV